MKEFATVGGQGLLSSIPFVGIHMVPAEPPCETVMNMSKSLTWKVGASVVVIDGLALTCVQHFCDIRIVSCSS